MGFFNSTFREAHDQAEAEVLRPLGDTLERYGSGLLPLGFRHGSPNSPVFYDSWARTCMALRALTHAGVPACPHRPLDALREADPRRMCHADDGNHDPAAARGLRAAAPARTDTTVVMVVNGRGALRVGTPHVALTLHDATVVPG